jgi:hypothetical protein
MRLIHVFRDKKGGAQFKISTEGERDDSLDAEYWLKYPGVISAHTENVWDAMIDAFEKYRYCFLASSLCIQNWVGWNGIDLEF